MAAWPGEEIEERAGDIADAADQLLRRQAAWRHRRVETLTMLSHEQVRRHVSVDFTVPAELRERLRLSDADEFAVPLAFLAKRPLVHFDLRNEEGHSIPLLTAEQSTMIGRELLEQALEGDLAAQDAGEETQLAVIPEASELIEVVLGEGDVTGAVERLERRHGLDPLDDFRDLAEILSRSFVLWAVVRGLERRRVFKFAYDEPFSQRLGLAYVYAAPGSTEAWSYHVEVAVPEDLRARTTRLWDAASGEVLVSGIVDADRPALYYVGDPARQPARPQVVVDYGAERSRFLGPAAIVATVIALLVALPSAVRRPPDAVGERRPGDRPRALDLGRVLRARAPHRRASAAAAAPDPIPPVPGGQHARRAVRRRGARLPGGRLDHRGDVVRARPLSPS